LSTDGEALSRDLKDLEGYPEARMVMSTVQVLLAEKRTALALFRTAMVIMVFAISLLSSVVVLVEELVWEHYLLVVVALGLMVYSGALMMVSRRRVASIDARVKAVIATLPPLKNTIGDLLDG
jgi:uncharacterized membrane protein YidH (DUF202 family)